MTSSSSQQQQPIIEDLDWEEWDSSGGLSFTHHCLAGSFAGVAEHTLLYPLDTVKTCWQSQVLHRAAAAGGGGSGNIATGCDPCSVQQTVTKLATNHKNSQPSAAATFQSTATVTNNKKATAAVVSSSQQQQQHQSIWSTMKHLMRHGSHHHHHHPGPAGHSMTTLSEASSITMATTHHLAPNVVDLTNTTNSSSSSSKLTTTTAAAANETSSSGGGSGGGKKQRPWSKSARIGRSATYHDIAPSLQPSLYHSSSSSSSSSSSATSTTSGAIVNNRHNHTGFKRLWRGVQTMFVGCIPAHALYFSSYEGIKSICLDHNYKNRSSSHNTNTDSGGGSVETTTSSQQHHVGIDTLSPLQAMVAGGVATLLHDFIMTPMDTMKQRMQLGHYYNLRDAFCSIVWGDRRQVVVGSSSSKNTIQEGVRMGGEGWKGLYRSFPITVMTNVPYGMIMMTTNEWLRAVLEDGIYGFHDHQHQHSHGDDKPFHFVTILLSGMGAGTVAYCTVSRKHTTIN